MKLRIKCPICGRTMHMLRDNGGICWEHGYWKPTGKEHVKIKKKQGDEI